MDKKEAILVSAYTGFLLTKDFSSVHKFCEDLLDRPIYTHEFENQEVIDEIRSRCKPLIIELVESEVEDNA